MRRLLYLTVLSMLVLAMTASVALAQSRGPSGADGSYNCPDFDTQPQAQAYFEANNPQQDPDGLDRDSDGLACEDSLPAGDEAAAPAGDDDAVAPTDEDDAVAPTGDDDAATAEDGNDDGVAAAQYAGDDQYADDDTVAELPNTGGLPLTALAAGLVVAGLGGLLLKRRMS